MLCFFVNYKPSGCLTSIEIPENIPIGLSFPHVFCNLLQLLLLDWQLWDEQGSFPPFWPQSLSGEAGWCLEVRSSPVTHGDAATTAGTPSGAPLYLTQPLTEGSTLLSVVLPSGLWRAQRTNIMAAWAEPCNEGPTSGLYAFLWLLDLPTSIVNKISSSVDR